MRQFAIAAAVLSAATASMGAYTFTGSPIVENFDGLPNSNPTGLTTSATAGIQVAVTGSGFDAAKIAGSGSTNTSMFADNGTRASGAIYFFGNASGSMPSSVNSETALGSIASGTNTMAFGFQLINGTAFPIDSVTIRFTQENWRSSTSTQNVLEASYSTASTATTYLTDAGFIDLNGLDLIGPAPVASNGALDGNDPANQVARLETISGLFIAPGDSLFVRWVDFNDVGNDAGLAIDNLNIVATLVVPEPASLGLIAAAGLVALRRR